MTIAAFEEILPQNFTQRFKLIVFVADASNFRKFTFSLQDFELGNYVADDAT